LDQLQKLIDLVIDIKALTLLQHPSRLIESHSIPIRSISFNEFQARTTLLQPYTSLAFILYKA